MGKNRAKLGASVGKSFGYSIRMMVGQKSDEKTKKTYKVHNGKYGIYAGKNLKEEVKSIVDAMDKIKTLVNK